MSYNNFIGKYLEDFGTQFTAKSVEKYPTFFHLGNNLILCRLLSSKLNSALIIQ